MASNKSKLCSALAILLWEEWDPIGVYDKDSEVDDEYNGYLVNLNKLLVECADSYKVTEYLSQCRIVAMGMSDSSEAKEHDRVIATKAIELKIRFLG